MRHSFLLKSLRYAVQTLVLVMLASHAFAQTTNRSTNTSSRNYSNQGTTNRGSTGSGSPGASSNSSSASRQYRSNTLLGDATIQIDPETRSLVIVTDEETHKELEKAIASLDRPKPQVLIKVVFVEVTYDKDYNVGIENTTGLTVNGAATANMASVLGVSELSALTSGSLGTTGSPASVATANLSLTLHALAEHGKVEILSRPSIMARNNQEAVITVGSEVPMVTNSRVTSDGQTINTVQYNDIGIILRVTPFITAEGTIEMIVAPEISALTDKSVAISNNASAPVISKRSAETVVVTPNGKTIVIGGLMQTNLTQSVQKVPLLGDIPGLGFVFRHTVKSDQKQELMIFLTPTIVNDSTAIDTVTDSEINRTEYIQQTFSQKEMDKYLDARLPEPDPAPQPAPRPMPVNHAK